MASLLDFERYGPDLQRQLLRRIGYTNGLHKIRRFARVVSYLYPLMPTSAPLLAQVIIREENARDVSTDRQLKGVKYATGIIDVTGALGLLERFGRKIALSSEGYACHALLELRADPTVLDGFLLNRIIEADGEYALNILRIVSEGTADVVAAGEELIRRFMQLIRFKQDWVVDNVPAGYAQKVISGLLSDAARTLERATTPHRLSSGAPPAEFFLKHTVKPRLEWLEDLGCIETSADGLAATRKGMGLLAELRELGGWADFGVYLPLNSWLAAQLEIPSFYEESLAEDFSWRLVAATYEHVLEGELLQHSHEELLRRVKEIYPAVKLANFNEADALSIYQVLAAFEAPRGRALPEAQFSGLLSELVEEFPSDVFKLSKRRGRGMYIALKNIA